MVRSNLVWGNPKGNLAFTDGLDLSDNLQAHPGFGPSDPYRPPPSSPAVDGAQAAGAPAIDFDNISRPAGGAPDIGAFETG